MNLQELRTFLSIVETGSLVRASEVLNVTQSTVTARLKSLEAELGQTLLIRNKSGATMTAAGLKLHRYADTIANLWQQARQETALPDGMSGVCNLACEYDLWLHFGQRFAHCLMEMYPDVGLSIWLGSQSDVAKWLDEGKSDLAFTYRAAFTQQQDQINLGDDTLILVSTSPGSPIRFDPTYVYVDSGEEFGRAHAIAYADAGIARISFGNATIGLEHLLRLGGSAYLPERIARDAIGQGQLYQLTTAPSFRRARYLTADKTAKTGWSWFDDTLRASLD